MLAKVPDSVVNVILSDKQMLGPLPCTVANKYVQLVHALGPSISLRRTENELPARVVVDVVVGATVVVVVAQEVWFCRLPALAPVFQ